MKKTAPTLRTSNQKKKCMELLLDKLLSGLYKTIYLLLYLKIKHHNIHLLLMGQQLAPARIITKMVTLQKKISKVAEK